MDSSLHWSNRKVLKMILIKIRLQRNALPENCRYCCSSDWIYLLLLDFRSKRRSRNQIRREKPSQHQEPSWACWSLLLRRRSLVLLAFAAFSTSFFPDCRWPWFPFTNQLKSECWQFLTSKLVASLMACGSSLNHSSLVIKMKVKAFKSYNWICENWKWLKIWTFLYGYARIFVIYISAYEIMHHATDQSVG